MKCFATALVTIFCATVSAEQTNPLSKVLDLLSDLQQKIIREGEAELKAYGEFVEWCDDTSKNAQNAIKTTTASVAKLEAKIGKLTSDISVATSKIEDLA